MASHSMTMVSFGSTICSFRDCFMMVGGCLTAGREINQLSVLGIYARRQCISKITTSEWKHHNDSLSRGMSKAQTLCHKSSSSAGLTSAPIFTVHGIQQQLRSPILLFSNRKKTNRRHLVRASSVSP